MKLPTSRPTKRVLTFDIENRPSSYWYDGQTTAQVTAIAWAFNDDPKNIQVEVLRREGGMDMMLSRFREAYDEADLVTGHFIRKHDLPILNGAYVEMGWLPLGPKMSSDTKLDLIRYSDQPKTQEYLSAIMGVPAPKIPMTQVDWREANNLTPKGVEKTIRRAMGDVKQHMQLRARLIENGMLRPPKLWRP